MFQAAQVRRKPWFAPLTLDQVAFVKKVYTYLFLTILVFSGAAYFAGSHMDIFAPISTLLYFGTLGMVFVSFFVRGSKPMSTTFLFVFATLLGLSLGAVFSIYLKMDPKAFMMALGTTIGIFGALTLYVFISGQNFSYLYGFLFIAIIGMLVVGLLSMFLKLPASMYTLWNYLGALIFTLYILADTSSVTRHFYTANNPAGAAFALFYDIVMLFLYLLSIFISRD